jgi:twitching motility protein PilI
MANRQALRELQDRLAQRLQAARAQGAAQSWLAIEAGAKQYLVPLSQAGEIFPYTNAQAVPYTQEWFLGVANLRGGLYGIVELAGYLSGAVVARTELRRQESRLLAFNPALETNCALVIDRLLGLRNPQAFLSAEAVNDPASPVAQKLLDTQGGEWLELDLQRMSQDVRFLTVGS